MASEGGTGDGGGEVDFTALKTKQKSTQEKAERKNTGARPRERLATCSPRRRKLTTQTSTPRRREGKKERERREAARKERRGVVAFWGHTRLRHTPVQAMGSKPTRNKRQSNRRRDKQAVVYTTQQKPLGENPFLRSGKQIANVGGSQKEDVGALNLCPPQ